MMVPTQCWKLVRSDPDIRAHCPSGLWNQSKRMYHATVKGFENSVRRRQCSVSDRRIAVGHQGPEHRLIEVGLGIIASVTFGLQGRGLR